MEDEFLFHRRNDYDSTWKVFDSSKTSLTIVLRVLYERFIIVGRKAKKKKQDFSSSKLTRKQDFGKKFREEKFSLREISWKTWNAAAIRHPDEIPVRGKRRFAGCFVKISLSLTVLLYIYLRGGSSHNFIRCLSRQKRRKLPSDAA